MLRGFVQLADETGKVRGLIARLRAAARQEKVKTEASGHAQRMRLVAIVAAGALLAGCAADSRPSDQVLARNGYWYHDGNRPGGGSGQASPQAIYNATHGTWLWPPGAGSGSSH